MRRCAAVCGVVPRQVRLLARQHAFGGYARFGHASASGELVCTRHHAIDWNFVGHARPRPNKWRVRATPAHVRAAMDGAGASSGAGRGEAADEDGGGVARGSWEAAERGSGAARGAVDDWQELAFADNDCGQPYYHERWSRLADGGASGGLLTLRACRLAALGSSGMMGGRTDGSRCADEEGGAGVGGALGEVGRGLRDAILVAVGDHFAYVVQRPVAVETLAPLGTSLAAVVDRAIECGDRSLAEACVLLEAGHGRVRDGWRIEGSLQPWRVGQSITDVFTIAGADVASEGDAGGAIHSLEDAFHASVRGGGAPLGGSRVRVGGRLFAPFGQVGGGGCAGSA